MSKSVLLVDDHSLVVEGLTNLLTTNGMQVGANLHSSERTPRYRMAEIMDRLYLGNRNQVIAYAGQIGLVPEQG